MKVNLELKGERVVTIVHQGVTLACYIQWFYK